MPLVTDLWFTSLTRIMIWRGLFMVSGAVLATSLTTYPLYANSLIPLSWEIKGLWIMAGITLVVATWRWYHWRQIQRANIFEDGK